MNDFDVTWLITDGLPHDPTDWLGPECDRFHEILGLNFAQSEALASALAHAFRCMNNDELINRYRAVQDGLVPLEITGYFIEHGGLIFEWAGCPLLVTDMKSL